MATNTSRTTIHYSPKSRFDVGLMYWGVLSYLILETIRRGKIEDIHLLLPCCGL